ncbi:MAG: carboxypeptidase regulatory-like domain-containing protein [Planctomycetia bacterium]|nr:carboxypeptidase regulatory-like domain-containing protein [Planctomycetia bacterium]
MRPGPFLLAVATLLAVAGAAVWFLRPGGGAVVSEGEAAEDEPAVREAAALAAGGRARGDAATALTPATSGTIAGVVRRDGKPVAARVVVHLRTRPRPGQLLDEADPSLEGDGARIPTEGGDDGTFAVVEAGADGAFRCTVPAPASYVVVATDAEGARGRATVRLLAAGARGVVDLALLRGTERLVGRARHADGRPFVGAVGARRAGDAQDFLGLASVPTDAEGRFVLEGLVAGPYLVTAFVAGRFAAHSRIVVVPRAEEVVLVVDTGLVPHAGRVVADADGKPLAGARVETNIGAVLGLGSVASRAVTDGDGRFEVLVGAGGVDYGVDAPGFEPLRLSRSRPMDAPVELRLRRAARVQGRVTRDGDGAPVAGVPVFARSDDGPLHGVALTDASGRFEIAAVSPGPVTVFAHGAGVTTKGLSAWRVGDGFNPFEVSVEPDATVHVDLVVVAAGAAVGKVLDAGGAPVVGATITPERVVAGGDHDPLSFLGNATAVATDEAGAFRCDSLLLDTSYRFLATVARGATGRAGPVRVEAGRVATVEIRLAAPRAGVVRCELADKRPLAGAMVYAYKQIEGRWDFCGADATSATGEARFVSLPPGPIYVYAQCYGYGPEGDNSTTVGSDADDATELTHTFVFKPSASVAGVVRWAGGEPARGLHVEGKTEHWSAATWIGEDGAFSFEDVDEGGLALKVFAEDGEVGLTETRAKAGDQAVVVTLPKAKPPSWRLRVLTVDGRPVTSASVVLKGEDHALGESVVDGWLEIGALDVPMTAFVYGARGVGGAPLPFGWTVAGPFDPKSEGAEVRLPREMAIAGIVKDGAGQPVRGVALWARPKELPPAFDDADDDVSWARTGADGRFRIGRLSAGLHSVRVSAPDSAGAMEPVDAPAGKTDLEIVLAAGLEAPLTVLDADGKPVEGAIVFIERPNARRVVDESDSAGVARPRGLDPSARYDLRIEPPLRRADCLPLERTGWSPGESPVTLPRGLALRGVVRDGTGRPVAHANVERLSPDGETQQRTTSGRDGGFELTRVPEGTTRLVARSSDEALAGPTVSVTAGAENVVLLVAPTVTLKLAIADWAGPPQAWLRLVDEDGNRGTPWAQVDAAGLVAIAGVRPSATYRVYQTWEVDGGKHLVVAATGLRGDAGTVKLTAVEGKRIVGRVLLPTGVDWWNVQAVRDGTTREAATGDEGAFVLDGLAEGTWTLEVHAQAAGGTWRATVPIEAGATDLVLEPQPPK